MKVKDGDKICVHKQNEDKSPGEKMKCYTGDSADADATKYMRALYANSEMQALKGFLVELEGESLEQKMRSIQDAFSQVSRAPRPEVAQNISYCYIKEIYEGYVIVEEEGDNNLYKAIYSIDNEGKVTFQTREEWTSVKRTYTEMEDHGGGEREDLKVKEASSFIFTELSTESSETYIDGLAAGTFTAMNGEEITFKPADLSNYVKNTQAIIESTRTEKGEIVGLPIDFDAHDHKGGAGWIIGVELDEARKIIKFLVNWTKEGARIIKENIRRYFSPSVDDTNKSILGGSLTNWPATRSAKGHIMLRPIELSQNMKGIDMPKTLEELESDVSEMQGKLDTILKAVQGSNGQENGEGEKKFSKILSPEIMELLGSPEALEQMDARAQEMAQATIHLGQRKKHVTEFAAKIAGGTKEKPFGLPIRTGDLISLLLSLPEAQSLAVEKVLERTWHNAVDFAEHGVDGDGFPAKRTLPKELQGAMAGWVKAGHPVEEFFAVNPEAGSADEYDLRAYAKKEE
jgi:hypothetical protein